MHCSLAVERDSQIERALQKALIEAAADLHHKRRSDTVRLPSLPAERICLGAERVKNSAQISLHHGSVVFLSSLSRNSIKLSFLALSAMKTNSAQKCHFFT